MLTLFNVTFINATRPLQRAAMLLTLLSSVGAAHASTALIDWPTYLRTGPGREFAVLQELARGAPIEVLACSGRWCSVQLDRGIGFVEQHALGQPTPPATPNISAEGCFNSQRAGYENGEAFRYCPR